MGDRGGQDRDRLSARRRGGLWIDLVEDELGVLPRDEKPWIMQDLAGPGREPFCRRQTRPRTWLFALLLE